MDVLKHFLDKVCDDNFYTYEKLDNLAEIFKEGDIVPAALIEWDYSLGSFLVKFRIGLTAGEVAALARDMATVDCAIIFEEDFIIHPEYGYIYGEEATKFFIESIQNNIQEAQYADAMAGAVYVSQEPIFTYGMEGFGKTKLEKYWGDE